MNLSPHQYPTKYEASHCAEITATSPHATSSYCCFAFVSFIHGRINFKGVSSPLQRTQTFLYHIFIFHLRNISRQLCFYQPLADDDDGGGEASACNGIQLAVRKPCGMLCTHEIVDVGLTFASTANELEIKVRAWKMCASGRTD